MEPFEYPAGISRHTIVRVIKAEPQIAKDLFLNFVKETLTKPIPDKVFEKIINAGKEYGEFDIEKMWLPEAEEEIWDGMAYTTMENIRIAKLKDIYLDNPQI